MGQSRVRKIGTLATVGVAFGALLLPAAASQAAAGHASPGHASRPAAPAAKKVSFGAKLTPHSQPSNSFSPATCESDTGNPGSCTRVETAALGRNDEAVAPKDGTIGSIKLVAGDAGKFTLEIAKAKPTAHKAKIVEKGPVIHYAGQGGVDNGGPYTVESFPVNMTVKAGEYLAIRAASTSLLQCSGGGLNQLLFQPPLAIGGSYVSTTHVDGCLLLLEAIYKS